jgi:hypothetical protein
MKIKLNPSNRKIFMHLCDGEVFQFDDVVYMKIEAIQVENEIELNAVDLSDGVTYYFHNEEVIPLKNAVLIAE